MLEGQNMIKQIEILELNIILFPNDDDFQSLAREILVHPIQGEIVGIVNFMVL